MKRIAAFYGYQLSREWNGMTSPEKAYVLRDKGEYIAGFKTANDLGIYFGINA